MAEMPLNRTAPTWLDDLFYDLVISVGLELIKAYAQVCAEDVLAEATDRWAAHLDKFDSGEGNKIDEGL